MASMRKMSLLIVCVECGAVPGDNCISSNQRYMNDPHRARKYPVQEIFDAGVAEGQKELV